MAMTTGITEPPETGMHTATRKPFWRRHVVAIWAVPLGILAVVWFFVIQPRTVTTVDEAFPTAAARPPAAVITRIGNAAPAQAASVRFAAGTFVRVGEDGSGTASLFTLGDGKAVLRLDNFRVANGPDLRVVLRDASGADLDLGGLKGNDGNQTYDIPAGTDLAKYHTAAIYCRVAHVTFIQAPLS